MIWLIKINGMYEYNLLCAGAREVEHLRMLPCCTSLIIVDISTVKPVLRRW